MENSRAFRPPSLRRLLTAPIPGGLLILVIPACTPPPAPQIPLFSVAPGSVCRGTDPPVDPEIRLEWTALNADGVDLLLLDQTEDEVWRKSDTDLTNSLSARLSDFGVEAPGRYTFRLIAKPLESHQPVQQDMSLMVTGNRWSRQRFFIKCPGGRSCDLFRVEASIQDPELQGAVMVVDSVRLDGFTPGAGAANPLVIRRIWSFAGSDEAVLCELPDCEPPYPRGVRSAPRGWRERLPGTLTLRGFVTPGLPAMEESASDVGYHLSCGLEIQQLDPARAREAGAEFHHNPVESPLPYQRLGVGDWQDSDWTPDGWEHGRRVGVVFQADPPWVPTPTPEPLGFIEANPEAYVNFRLKNGWRVIAVDASHVWNWADTAFNLEGPVIGSDDPYMKANIRSAATNTVNRVGVVVLIQGPAGTDPYQD